LHTLFRIFDGSSGQLNAAAWKMCYRIIIFEMLKANEANFQASQSIHSSQQGHISVVNLNETAIIMVEGISKLFMRSFATMTAGAHFPEIWRELLKSLEALLDRAALGLSTAVCAAMTNLLSGIEKTEKLGKPSIVLVWNMWKDNNPVSHVDSSNRRNDNQKCLVAYLDWLHEIYRLVGSEMQLEQIRDVAKRLQSLVIGSEAAAYAADHDAMTEVQKYVLQSLKEMPAGAPGAVEEIIGSLAGFVRLAYENESANKGQTYVALSKSAMDLLNSCITDHVGKEHALDSDLLTQAILALGIPVKLKYKWPLEGREPKTWRKATTTAVAILEACIPSLPRLRNNPTFWDAVVNFSNGIIAADCQSCTTPSDIPQDEEFDIEAYSRLRQLLTRGIGSNEIPDAIRYKYIESIFNYSIIHAPHPDDLARPGQELLQGLQSVHIGRTQSLPQHPRSKLCYVLLHELFHLVDIKDGSPDGLKLAQAAGPFLILRAGISIKAYVHDQPLRGRMPLPRSQKQELLLILRELQKFYSEPRAIPVTSGVGLDHMKHMHRLYPLIVQATEAAWRDEELTTALTKILATIGQDLAVFNG
jgi:hypothetical protein